MARRTLVTLAAWTPRGPAPSRGSGHGAQKVYAHALHACATAEVLVASQHAVSVPHRLAVCTDVDGRSDGSRLGRMEQRALSSYSRARRAACWPEFGGIKQLTNEHSRREIFKEVGSGGVAMVAMVATRQKSRKCGSSLPSDCNQNSQQEQL